MEQLTKNQAVATSQEAVQNQNEPQLRDENAHNDKSVHGVLNPTYQAGLRRDAVQPDIEAERKKRDEIEAGRQIRANTISFTVFPEIVPSIGNSFINTMKNINHTRSSISDDIRNILCSSANMRRAIPLILRLLMN